MWRALFIAFNCIYTHLQSTIQKSEKYIATPAKHYQQLCTLHTPTVKVLSTLSNSIFPTCKVPSTVVYSTHTGNKSTTNSYQLSIADIESTANNSKQQYKHL